MIIFSLVHMARLFQTFIENKKRLSNDNLSYGADGRNTTSRVRKIIHRIIFTYASAGSRPARSLATSFSIPNVYIKQKRLSNDNLSYGADGRNRTGTVFNHRRILSPVRLPVPPHLHVL